MFRPGRVLMLMIAGLTAVLVVVGFSERAAVKRAARLERRDAMLMLARLPRRRYKPAGQYVGPQHTNIDPPAIILGADGVPRVRYGSGYQPNPVTTAQYGLWAYGNGRREIALRAADWLVAHQRAKGEWLYRFDFSVYGWYLSHPWASAMAQGQAMSLLERSYRTTRDPVYLRAAVAALHSLKIDVDDGGLSRCFHDNCKLPFFEEYPTANPTYVLNGFMFTLIGIYDLSSVAPDSGARDLFNAGVRTLNAALPSYDTPSGALYELGYQAHVASPKYQAIHIYLLRALNTISPHRRFRFYADRWADQL